MKYFHRLHPVSAFIYLLGVIAISMFTRNPAVIVPSFLFSLGFYCLLAGGDKLLKSLAYSLPVMILITLSNPIFSHRGETVIFFVNDTPITAESLLFGFFSSLMILSVFYWFKAYSEVMTADKTVYLFGRAMPHLALTVSMTLEGLDKVGRYYREIDDAQRGLGIYGTDSLWDRLRLRLRVISILITICLERSVEGAQSMLARGYGLSGRSCAKGYRAEPSDYLFGVLSLILSGVSLALLLFNKGEFSYYPILDKISTEKESVLLYACIFALFSLSVICEIKENIKWHYLKSKI